jgi:hypothetical protein
MSVLPRRFAPQSAGHECRSREEAGRGRFRDCY